MAAAHNGNEEIIKLLIFHGADIKAVDNEGKDAAAIAELCGHEEALKLIRSGGVKVTV
jgi:ankyrin repeat protein